VDIFVFKPHFLQVRHDAADVEPRHIVVRKAQSYEVREDLNRDVRYC
jgi:hypothetical protein